jgi:TolB protein
VKFLFVFGLIFFSSYSTRAELRIQITQGHIQPVPIAIVDFEGESIKLSQKGQEIVQIVRGDLEESGVFRHLDPHSFIQITSNTQRQIRFADWRLINAQALVVGVVKPQGSQHIRVEFCLFDVFSERQLEKLVFTGEINQLRRLAHKISDIIFQRITGEIGYFNTQIVYVAERGPEIKRIKKIAIMDQDGANHQFLTDGTSLVLTPRYSPLGGLIAYLDFTKNNISPRVYLLDLKSGKRRLLGKFPGMTFAPRFSPNGRFVIMSLMHSGNSSLYSLSLYTGQVKRLTSGPVIDTSPCYSPDATQVVLNSNRGGNQQIYVMNADGSNLHRISFGRGLYASPVWSPRGDMIAFTKIYKKKFYVGVMNADGSEERLLAEGYHIDEPIWSPNGRLIIFSRQSLNGSNKPKGATYLYSIDLTSYNEREVSTPGEATGPSWSPALR